jgi:putative proteasome-type protease
LQQHEVDFTASFILAGQIKGGQLRLFMIYDAGNFIEALGDTTYFQIGEVKYGKPILDRIIRRDTSLADAAKCALISFDSTMRSNVSVGPPIDVLIYRRNSLKPGFSVRLEEQDPYLKAIRDTWGGALYKAFHEIVHDPGWTF